jgi:hypothetical protein
MMRNVVRAALPAFAIASPLAFGAADFSGTWVLDPAKGNLGAGAVVAKSPMLDS